MRKEKRLVLQGRADKAALLVELGTFASRHPAGTPFEDDRGVRYVLGGPGKEGVIVLIDNWDNRRAAVDESGKPLLNDAGERIFLKQRVPIEWSPRILVRPLEEEAA